MKNLIFVIYFVSGPLISGTGGANCGNGDHIGEGNPDSKKDSLDTTTGLSMLQKRVDKDFTFDCCGRVDSWEYYAKDTGTLYLQVWREIGATWTLVGQNTITVTASEENNENTFDVPTAEEITVMNNDVVGIYTPVNPIVAYKKGGGGNTRFYYTTSITSTTVGSTTFDWNSASQNNDRKYALRANLSPGNNPTFGSNLDATQSIFDDTAPGTLLYTIAATDADVTDTLTYAKTSGSASFSFSTSTLQVTTVGYLNAGTFTVSFSVTDVCSNQDTGNLIITVSNHPPVIQNLPNSINVPEDQSVEDLLIQLNVTDQSLGDTITCTLVSSTPTSTDFFMKIVPSTSDYGIYVRNKPTGLDYHTTREYTLAVSCDDGTTTVTGSYTVYVTKNNPPVITNLQASISVNASSTSLGTILFTVVSTDSDSSQLYYNMTCSVSPCCCSIYNSGAVLLTTDLSTTTFTGCDMYIYVYDGYTLVGPKTLTLTVEGINNAPVISNLPLASAKAVPENIGLGTSVFQVSVTDVNSGDTHTYTAAYDPPSGSSLFWINSTSGIVYTSSSNNIDYEALTPSTTFNITVTVSDGQATDSEILQIVITNLNEAPSFGKSTYIIDGNEGNAAALVGTPSFDVTDPDTGATKTYSIDSPEFTIDAASGAITFSANYDVDTGAATSTTCTVTVSDGQLTDTASLVVNVNDINDNTPQFNKASYIAYVSAGSAVGTTVVSVNATDSDISAFGDITYTLSQGSPEYFGITSTGNVYIKHDLSTFASGTTLSITANATDTGGLSDSVVITIIIPVSTTPTTTSTTDQYRTFFDDTRNLAWLTIVILILCVFVGVVALLVYRWVDCKRCSKYCRKSKKIRRWPSYRKYPEPQKQYPRLTSFISKSSSPVRVPANTGNTSWNAWGISDYSKSVF